MPSLNAVMPVPEVSTRPASLASLRDKLSQLFSKVKLPSSPALATKILELTEDPDASIDDFANVIRLDGSLSARLLKMSNSASLGQRTPVTTIPKAVSVLGLSRVKTAALGFQLVGHLNKLGSCPFDMTRYWQQAVLRGCVARELAGIIVPRLREEAFLVGLLQDTGVLLLVQVLGRDYADLYQKYAHSHATFYAHERTDARYAHVDASAVMAH
ncbi:MAG: HDOD domain-containing protein, partial [Planctomycetota bacterium]